MKQFNTNKFLKFEVYVNDKVDINGTLPTACDPEFAGSFAHVPHSDNQGGILMPSATRFRAEVVFGLNDLKGKTLLLDNGSTVGAWDSMNVESLMHYTLKKNYTIYGWKLDRVPIELKKKFVNGGYTRELGYKLWLKGMLICCAHVGDDEFGYMFSQYFIAKQSQQLSFMSLAKKSGIMLSYDVNLRQELRRSADATCEGIMSIWDQANVNKAFPITNDGFSEHYFSFVFILPTDNFPKYGYLNNDDFFARLHRNSPTYRRGKRLREHNCEQGHCQKHKYPKSNVSNLANFVMVLIRYLLYLNNLKCCSGNILTLVLWNELATGFEMHIYMGLPKPLIIVVASCWVKKSSATSDIFTADVVAYILFIKRCQIYSFSCQFSDKVFGIVMRAEYSLTAPLNRSTQKLQSLSLRLRVKWQTCNGRSWFREDITLLQLWAPIMLTFSASLFLVQMLIPLFYPCSNYVIAATGIAGFINGWYYDDPHNTMPSPLAQQLARFVARPSRCRCEILSSFFWDNSQTRTWRSALFSKIGLLRGWKGMNMGAADDEPDAMPDVGCLSIKGCEGEIEGAYQAAVALKSEEELIREEKAMLLRPKQNKPTKPNRKLLF
ncbi:glycoside hydrolase, family 79 [Artemisia annua]|uniref:Glycoside hydrolase, family 79 n=1 Tax=Artemisia annua TaxID=35608 RepID=A0A2U1P8B2_ARTAN|nr:glycoside hydrolase, family 79 [Artemisia annua]